MNNAIRHRSRTMIVAVFLLLICSAASGLWLASQKQAAEKWVRHTFEVSEHLAKVRILSLRAEVYRRGYLLTGTQEDFLAVEAQRGVLPRELDALRSMITDNPEQGVRVARLASLIQERLSAAQQTMWLRRTGRTAEAIAALDSAESHAATVRLLRTINEIETEEDRLLAERLDRANAYEQPVRIAFVGSAFLVLLLALLVLRDRRARMLSLREANDQLEQDIARREIAEAQLALLAQNATDAVFRIDLDGTVTYASPSTEQVLGIQPELAVGGSMAGMVHKEDKPALFDFYTRLVAGEIERGVTTNRIAKYGYAGVETWIEASCGLVRDPASGAPIEVIASLRDVTKRKHLEFALEIARARAEAAASAKSSFLANMSHEIRTPMNGVLGFADLLLHSELNHQQQRHAQLIVDSGKAMMRLLNDILDISKIEAGQMQIAPERVDFRHALRNCVKLIEPAVAQKGLRLWFDIEPELPMFVLIDGLRLRQIVLNLLGNAVKFTETGSVSIEAKRGWHDRRAHIEITVADTGIGIAQDRQPAIFEQFVQAEQSTARRFGGTGLGLAISSQLATLMGGTLVMESEEGKGTRFTLRVPLKLADPGDAHAPVIDPPKQEVERPLRILLAEDHDVNQALVEAMLGKLGHESVTAVDGAQALAAAVAAARSAEPFDLVLMDMQMPVMDGIQATKAIRDAGISAETLPILALTANAYADDVAACLAAGMQAHVAKPVQLADLGKAIRRWARPEPLAIEPDADAGADADADAGEPAPAPAPRPAAKLVISPELRARYDTRKAELLALAERIAASARFDDEEISELRGLLHKLAGSAGLFHEAQLGVRAADLEDALEICPLGERPAKVREVTEALTQAA
ncbi:ATP-binding protein [Sphingomonas sp. HF-S4]|uniref:histidine kinase n=1 Tax=Sphingomonas agrestis TaxID=3080540 RepID=A0ABU3Y214_9SPHN|nr:ATP-binding protein [Sphingomonas sp. HF-S4]MDV3455418.1 ATP-binding protein [Sphingomonas sp. HF-S4]